MAATRSCPWWAGFLALLVSVGLITLLYLDQSSGLVRNSAKSMGIKIGDGESSDTGGTVPAALLGLEIYHKSDFLNERGIIPPYWNCLHGECNSSEVWGPCYPPHKPVSWAKEVDKYHGRPPYYQKTEPASRNRDDLSGYCRPGFLIIGAGKCGTR